ncbi:MAG: THUMP domain-containing protein [Nitrospiraceae bacterium]
MTTIEDMARESRSNQQVVMGWNVLATAKNHEQGHLARLFKRFGDFGWAPYLGVLLGRVEDHQAFFEQLRRGEESAPGFLRPLARLVPLDRTFLFTTDTLIPLLKEELVGHIDQIGSGSFHVRLERRGHKGVIHSQQIEQELARIVADVQAQRGHFHRVDFKDPDVIIAIEIVGNECGVGLITRQLRERYPFVKVP